MIEVVYKCSFCGKELFKSPRYEGAKFLYKEDIPLWVWKRHKCSAFNWAGTIPKFLLCCKDCYEDKIIKYKVIEEL